MAVNYASINISCGVHCMHVFMQCSHGSLFWFGRKLRLWNIYYFGLFKFTLFHSKIAAKKFAGTALTDRWTDRRKERWADKQTDRQTNLWVEKVKDYRQFDRRTDRQKDKQKNGRDIQANGQTDRQTNRLTKNQLIEKHIVHRQTDGKAYRMMGKAWTDRCKDRWVDKQKDRQTYR